MGREQDRKACGISTHAPAGGATIKPILLPIPICLFLLTPLREGRRLGMEEIPCVVTISTHAPAGGATRMVV